MEMISPNVYIESKKKWSIDELEKEKIKLINDIEKINENIINNVPEIFNSSRDTKLKMYESYLEELDRLIETKK